MLFGAIAGVLTAAVALGVGQLVSGLTVRQGSPAVVVGQAAIDLAPPPVKNFAISVFGANDKTALVIGILVVLAIVAAVIGVAAMRRLAYGYAGLVLFAAIGLAAALSRPDATFGYAVPTIFGAAVGAFALNRLTRAALATTGLPPRPACSVLPVRLVHAVRLRATPTGTTRDRRGRDPPDRRGRGGSPRDRGRATAEAGPGRPRAEPRPRSRAPGRPRAGPEAGTESPGGRYRAHGEPATDREPASEWVPWQAGAATDREPASEWLPAAEPGPETELPTWVPNGSADRGLAAAGTVPSGRSAPSPDDVLSGPRPAPDTWTYRPPSAPGPGRRRFLVASGVAAGGAALADLAGRELNARQSVTEARSTLRIPSAVPARSAARTRD